MTFFITLREKINTVVRINKILSYISQARLGEQTGFVLQNKYLRFALMLLFLFSISVLMLIFTGLTFYYFLLNPSLVAPLFSWFGSSENFVLLAISTIFVLAFLLKFIILHSSIQEEKVRVLIYSSPTSSRDLGVSWIMSNQLLIDFALTIFILISYSLFKIQDRITISLDMLIFLVSIILLFLTTLITSLLGSIYAIALTIKNTTTSPYLSPFKEKYGLMLMLITIPVLLAFFSKIPIISIFSPLGWSTYIISAIFFTKDTFFLMFVIPLGIFLISSYYLIPDMTLEIKEKKYSTKASERLNPLNKSISKILSKVFKTSNDFIEQVFLKEDWETKRPMKLILLTVPIVLVFLLLDSILFEEISILESEVLIHILLIFSVITPLISFLYYEIGFSFFNYRDNRLLLFKSTPSGINNWIIIRISLLIIWQFPTFILVAIILPFVKSSFLAINTFLFIIGAGVLLTTTSLFYQSIILKYFRIGFNFRFNWFALFNYIFISTFIVFPSLMLIISMDYLGIQVEIISILYLALSIIVGIIILKLSIKNIERNDLIL